MAEATTLVTGEQIKAIRDNAAAKAQLDNATRNAGSRVSVAIGDVGRESGSASSVAALLEAHMIENILDRLKDTVDGKNKTKPVSMEAVGYAISQIDPDKNYTALRQAVGMEDREYQLSADLRERLKLDFEKTALEESARNTGMMVS
ncbi:MAG: hypothetical protein SFW63_01830 [Alphaproteobacteria bacterium]|nr:hypothetical protein [Alphaproteobacteria bacterium]